MKLSLNHISTFLTDPIRQFQLSFILRQAAMLLGSIFIAHSALNLEEIGQLEWLFYLGYIGTFFWSGGLLQTSLKSSENESPKDKHQILWNVFCAKLALILFWFGLMSVLSVILIEDTGISLWTYFHFLMWMMGSIISTFIPFFYYRILNGKALFLYNLAFFITYAGLFLWFMWSRVDLNSVVLSLGIFGLLLLIYTLISTRFILKLSWNQTNIWSTLKQAWPLMGYALMAGLALITDGWLVKWWDDDDEVFAVFRYGARELPMSIAATVALSNAVIPLISASLNDGLLELKRRSCNWMHLLFPLSILLAIFSVPLYQWAFGTRFLDSVILFDGMLLIIISRLLFPQAVLLARGEYRMVFNVSIAETVLNVVLSILLLYFFGLIGIVIGTVLAFLFEKLCMIVIIKKRLKIPLSHYHPWAWHTLYSSVLCIILLLKYCL